MCKALVIIGLLFCSGQEAIAVVNPESERLIVQQLANVSWGAELTLANDTNRRSQLTAIAALQGFVPQSPAAQSLRISELSAALLSLDPVVRNAAGHALLEIAKAEQNEMTQNSLFVEVKKRVNWSINDLNVGFLYSVVDMATAIIPATEPIRTQQIVFLGGATGSSWGLVKRAAIRALSGLSGLSSSDHQIAVAKELASVDWVRTFYVGQGDVDVASLEQSIHSLKRFVPQNPNAQRLRIEALSNALGSIDPRVQQLAAYALIEIVKTEQSEATQRIILETVKVNWNQSPDVRGDFNAQVRMFNMLSEMKPANEAIRDQAIEFLSGAASSKHNYVRECVPRSVQELVSRPIPTTIRCSSVIKPEDEKTDHLIPGPRPHTQHAF